MSVEQLDVVDVVSIDKKTGHVILTISDHLDWSDTNTELQGALSLMVLLFGIRYLPNLTTTDIVQPTPLTSRTASPALLVHDTRRGRGN